MEITKTRVSYIIRKKNPTIADLNCLEKYWNSNRKKAIEDNARGNSETLEFVNKVAHYFMKHKER